MKDNVFNENSEGLRDTPAKPDCQEDVPGNDQHKQNQTASFGPKDLMVGNTIGHYRLISILGQGGMGIVFKAQDTTLDRLVALKFPSPHVLAEEGKKARFIHEAKAAAALDHPNVCTLHEIAEIQGKTFICMAYVEGKPLSEKIISGPLDLNKTIDIAIQIAKGLQEAHERKIVHRDVKSANIMVSTDGQVKITDFGLAKLAGETHLTRQGAIMGTVDYMSPEQAKGEPVDQRTDIWSLGVVMYEMLTGELPFKGTNEQATIHAIIYEKPTPIRELRRDVPLPLEKIVRQMMQKAPKDRLGDMSLVIEKLLSIKNVAKRTGNVQEKLPSIAVLPFVNMSADPNQEYFCDGMAEELINALTQIKGLHVIARTSAFSFKGKNINVCEIGRELSVQTILEGSVRKAGSRLRITAQLVDTTHGHHLWSERYDREMGDVFAVQDEITLAIVNKLKPKLLREEEAKLAKQREVDIDAYHLYLKGLFHWNKRTETDLKKAISYFKQAKEEDKHYGLTHVGLALSNAFLPIYCPMPSKETVPQARESALRALQIDDTLPEAHAALGYIKTWFDWDWVNGEDEFTRAIELNPGYAAAHHFYMYNLIMRCRYADALNEIKRALELDPISVSINRDLALAYCYSGQFERSIEASMRALEMNPSMFFVHHHLGSAYLGMAMYEEALKEFQQEIATGSVLGPAEISIVFVYVQMGKNDKANEMHRGLIETFKQRYLSPACLADSYIFCGDYDTGFELMNRAYDQKDPWLSWIKTNPLHKSLHSDPRYVALLKKMHLED